MRSMVLSPAKSGKSSRTRPLSNTMKGRVYGALLDRLPEAVAVLDPEGRYLEMNDAHLSLIGTASCTVPQTPAVFLGEETFAEMMSELARTGGFRRRLSWAMDGGKRRWLDYWAASVEDEQGRHLYYVTTATDVTDRTDILDMLSGCNGESKGSGRQSETGDGDQAEGHGRQSSPGLPAADVLRESQALLSVIMEATTDIVFVKDLQGRYRHMNATGCRAVGRTIEDVIGKDDDEIWPADLAICCKEADRLILESGQAQTLEESTTIGGRTITYLTAKAPYRDETGRIIGIVGVARDITERKASEAALRLSEERLREALRASNTGVWEWNTQTNEVTYSREWKGQIGYREEELSDSFETWESRLHPDDHDRLMGYVKTYLESPGSDYQHEFRLRHKDGSYRWIAARGSFVAEPDGRRVRLLGSHTDITDRKNAEEALRVSEERLRTFLEHVPSLAFLKGLDGRYLYVNRRFEEVLGLPEGSALGKDDYELFDQAQAEQFVANDAAVLSSDRPAEFEEVVVHADGPHTSLVVKFPLRDAFGHTHALGGLATDITERKRIDDDRKARTTTLMKHQAALLELVRVDHAREGLIDALERVTETVAQAMGVERVGIWLMDPRRAEFECQDLYSLRDRRHAHGMRMPMASCPRFLEALQDAAVIAAADARLDPRTSEFAADYLIPLGICSLMEAPIRRNGVVVGVLCHERVGPPREWSMEQQEFAQVMADHIALIFESFDRRRAETSLQESEQRLALAVHGSTDAVWDVKRLPGRSWSDPENSIWWSPRIRDVLSLDPSEAFCTVGHWIERLHPDDREGVMAQVAAHVERRAPYDTEYRLRTSQGEYRWIRARGQAMWDGQGEPFRMSGSCQDFTDRKMAEEALRQSEERYRRLSDLSPIGMFVMCEGATVYVNQAACRIVGAPSAEALLSRPPLDFVHPDCRAAVEESVRTLLAGGGPVRRAERRYLQWDGTEIEVEVEAAPITWEGKPAIQGIFSDITERKRAEEALRASECRLKEAQRIAHIGSWELDLRRNVLSWSDEIYRIFEIDPEKFGASYEAFLASVHPDDRDAVNQAYAGSLASMTPYSIVHRLLFPDGRMKYVHEQCEHFYAPDGRAIRSVGTVQDVTDRKQAEDALRISEERFRVAFQNAAIGMVLGGHDGVRGIEEANQAFCSLLGYSEKELSGLGLQAITHPEDVAKIEDIFRQLLSGELASTTIEQRYVRKDGATMWALNSVSSIRDETGRFVNSLTLVQDITERRRLEAAQECLIQELSRSHQHFKTLFNWTPSAVGLSTLPDGRLIDVNEGFLRLTGYSREELIGRTTLELGLWADPSDRAAVLQELAARGELLNREGLLRTKSGEVRCLMVSVETIQMGSSPCLIYIAQDITERKREEEVLRFAKFSVEHAVDAVYWVNAQAGILDVNQAACAMLGYTKAELCAMTVHDINPLFQADRWPAYWAETKERGTASIETYHRAKNGRMIPVEISVNHLSYGSDEYHCAFVRNVTERKRAEGLRAGESTIFEAIARHRSLVEVLTLLSRTVEEACEDVRCSILLLDPDGMHLRIAAAPSLPDEYKRAVDGVAIGPNVGSWGTAAYRNEPVFVADIEHDPLWADYRASAILHGLRACWSTPICTAERKVLGTIALYASSAPRLPSAYEINVVERMTHLAAFAIERLRAEEALRESRANLRRITDAIPGVVYQYRVGPDGAQSFAFASRGTKELLGCEAEELEADANVGWSVVLPQELEGLKASIAVSAAALSPWTHEFRVRVPNGDIKWLRGASRPERQTDGGIVWYGLFTDVTARRRAEQQLRFTQFAMDHAADAILVVGPDTRIVYANHEACRSLGYTQEELLERSIADIAPQYNPERFAERLVLLKQGERLHYESVHRTKDGRDFPVDVSVRYLEHDGVGYTCATARDITERQMLEQRLRHADRLATLGTITAGVAHELNNPLFVISGHLHLIERNLARRQLKAIRKELLAAQDAAQRASDIVNQFLYTAHASTGAAELCDVPAIARKALALLQSDFRSRRIAVAAEFAGDVPPIVADPQALLQIFLNLLTNARQAIQSHDGGGRIQFSIKTVDGLAGKLVECRLQDNGPGILPEHLPRIFDPFFTTKSVGEGTGLGLAICHRIVSELSGTITCTSQPGAGATFVVRLPVRLPNA